jgi:hypothetical protein
MTDPMHKLAMTKLAEIEATDRQAAFEAGFVKCAQDLGLDKDQYLKLRQIAAELASDAK